jgi:hypothetical protein
MASVSISGDVSGAISIAAPSAAGSGTLTLPVATDTLAGIAATQTLTNKTLTSPTITGATITVAATAAPAFSAYRSGTQATTSNTYTKVQLNAENFDTNNNYDSTTNYRFTPTVAGYYLCTGQIQTSGGTYVETDIYKNGVSNGFSQISGAWGIPTTQLISMNGSTDYIELYGFISTNTNIQTGVSTYFQAFLARSA